jgi:hypothetical protein
MFYLLLCMLCDFFVHCFAIFGAKMQRTFSLNMENYYLFECMETQSFSKQLFGMYDK